MTTDSYTFFSRPENNDASKRILGGQTFHGIEAGLAPWDALLAVNETYGSGALALGTGRTGIEEVQTDEGYWTRTSSNRRERSTWTFTTWAEYDAA